MSQNSCCVPGCAVVRKDGVRLHRFPDPETSEEKFKTWILNICGEIAKLDHQAIYDNRRVCHRHFEDILRYPSGRLSKLAIPTMHIPDLQAQSLGEAMVISESDTSQKSQLQKCGFKTSEPTGRASRCSHTDTDASRDEPRPIHHRGRRDVVKHAKAATLPGTSKPQPGPSGTGPAKRKHPDDSASPSTLQGDAKRVRVHSAQGEPRTYARATKDIPARLAVAICFPPPSRNLTKEEAEQVKVGLEDLLMGADSSSPLPAFRGYPRVAEGTVQMWCEDDSALTWLTQNVPLLQLPNTKLKLTVLRQSDVPTRVKASLFVPRYRGDIQRLHSILIRQNMWYDIARWSLYRATTVGGDNYGTFLSLGVPPEEVQKVLDRERRISYLLGSIYVRFWPTTQPSDCKTDPTTTLTETRTDDTDDIAQLEEEGMARAAMADDEATIPPTSSGWSEQLLALSPGDQHDGPFKEEAVEGLSDGSTTD